MVINYGNPIWFPFAARSNVKKLQVVQNNALRVVTGCHKMASENHSHSETTTLKLQDHLELLSTQFLANAMRPYHANHECVTLPPGPRNMKATLSSRFGHKLQPFPFPFPEGTIKDVDYSRTLSTLHMVLDPYY